MDTATLYRRAIEAWTEGITALGAGEPPDWDAPTPCRAWTVRDLVDHVVGEDLWTAPLVGGETIEQVGDRFAGDQLEGDPFGRALYAAGQAGAVMDELLPSSRTVHLSYGPERIEEYALQLAADHLVHAWDLAAATGGRTRLPTDLVVAVARWFADREDAYRRTGLIGERWAAGGDPRSEPPDPQRELIAAFGRDPSWGANHAGLARFSAAFGRGDVEEIMALMTPDCVFVATGPAPDGVRHEGAEAVRGVWEELFGTTRGASFTEEDSFVCGDSGVLRWLFEWVDADGSPGHVHGVDVLRLRDGKVSEKLSYVKG